MPNGNLKCYGCNVLFSCVTYTWGIVLANLVDNDILDNLFCEISLNEMAYMRAAHKVVVLKQIRCYLAERLLF